MAGAGTPAVRSTGLPLHPHLCAQRCCCIPSPLRAQRWTKSPAELWQGAGEVEVGVITGNVHTDLLGTQLADVEEDCDNLSPTPFFLFFHFAPKRPECTSLAPKSCTCDTYKVHHHSSLHHHLAFARGFSRRKKLHGGFSEWEHSSDASFAWQGRDWENH